MPAEMKKGPPNGKRSLSQPAARRGLDSPPWSCALFERTLDAGERGNELGAKSVHNADDGDGDACSDQTVFDGCRSGFVVQEFRDHAYPFLVVRTMVCSKPNATYALIPKDHWRELLRIYAIAVCRPPDRGRNAGRAGQAGGPEHRRPEFSRREWGVASRHVDQRDLIVMPAPAADCDVEPPPVAAIVAALYGLPV